MQVSSLVKKTDNRLHINLVGELEDPAIASSGSLIRLPPGEEDTIPSTSSTMKCYEYCPSSHVLQNAKHATWTFKTLECVANSLQPC